MSCSITASEFKEYFDRGQFIYGTDLPNVRDKDIEAAIAEAGSVFNDGLYPDEEACKMALYYLTAHFLTNDIEAATSGGIPSFVQTSHSADGVSESFQVPKWMTSGEFAFYSTTYYGQKFLILSKPFLDGAVFSVPGATHP
jgi:hypothetical protein